MTDEPEKGDSQYINIHDLPNVNDMKLHDLVLFDTGLVHAELVKVPANPNTFNRKWRPFVLIYGKCYDGDKCPHNHGVLVEPHLFFDLAERVTDSLTDELSKKVAQELLKVIDKLDKDQE